MSLHLSPPGEHIKRLFDLYQSFERTETPVEDMPESAAAMESLKAYRKNGGFVCAYEDEADTQKAFNITATAFGYDGRHPEQYEDVPEWSFMVVGPKAGAPMKQRGYLAVKTRKAR
jgi:hypothetical protein